MSLEGSPPKIRIDTSKAFLKYVASFRVSAHPKIKPGNPDLCKSSCMLERCTDHVGVHLPADTDGYSCCTGDFVPETPSLRPTSQY